MEKNSSKTKNYFHGKNDKLVIKKLTKAFKLGLDDEDACYFADITFYELRQYENEHKQLKDKKEQLKERYSLIQEKNDEWLENLSQKDQQRFGNYQFQNRSVSYLTRTYRKKFEDWGLETSKNDELNTGRDLLEIEKKIVDAMSLETKELMLKAIPVATGYKGFALELAESLERDFEVTTATEKSLVQMAVLAFVSYLHTNYEVQQNSYITGYSDEQRASTGYLIAVSKEKNNALRQYTAIIQTLKNLKASPIKFNIVTKNLNIGQQQINNSLQS